MLDVVLVDDRVRVDGEACGSQEVDEVAAPDARAVEEVVALPVTLDAALDRHLVVVDRQPPGGVVENKRDVGERGAGAALATRVDDLLHLPAPDVARLAGAEHPFDGVDDVGLA